MRTETHPWLKWPGCSAQRKIELNNKLATVQHKNMAQPRFADWDFINLLGIGAELDLMFNTIHEDIDGRKEIPVWRRAFDVKEVSYRELCLEFYCSIELKKRDAEDDVLTAKLITFRLGGREHKVSVVEFGLLLGMFTPQEVDQARWMRSYLRYADWDHNEFKKHASRVWNRHSGIEKHTAQSKAKDLFSPLLRVVHKLIAYTFYHRSTQHDKVYSEDLWLLERFGRRDPTRFINAPWALACYMEEKGAGRQHDSPMLCGHFITRLARNLGLLTRENVKSFSQTVNWKLLVKRDFQAWGLLTQEGRLIERGESVPRSPPRDQTSGRGTLSQAVNQLSEQMKEMLKQNKRIDRKIDRVDRNIVGLGNYCNYVFNRYQPSWEAMAIQHHQSTSSSHQLDPFAPPMMFPASPPRDESEEESGDEESDEDEEEESEDNEEEVGESDESED